MLAVFGAGFFGPRQTKVLFALAVAARSVKRASSRRSCSSSALPIRFPMMPPMAPPISAPSAVLPPVLLAIIPPSIAPPVVPTAVPVASLEPPVVARQPDRLTVNNAAMAMITSLRILTFSRYAELIGASWRCQPSGKIKLEAPKMLAMAARRKAWCWRLLLRVDNGVQLARLFCLAVDGATCKASVVY